MFEPVDPMVKLLEQIDLRLNKLKEEIIMEFKTASLTQVSAAPAPRSYSGGSKPPFDPKTEPKISAQQSSEIEAGLANMPKLRERLIIDNKCTYYKDFRALFATRFEKVMSIIRAQHALGKDID